MQFIVGFAAVVTVCALGTVIAVAIVSATSRADRHFAPLPGPLRQVPHERREDIAG